MALSKAMAAPFLFYNNLLERRPLFTKSITSGVMYAGGDAIAQYTETYNYNKDKEENEKRTTTLDRKRLLVFFVYGTCIGGPAYHYWFNYLNELPQVIWRLKQTQQRGKILRAYAYLRSHNIEVKLDMSKLPVTAPLTKWKGKAAKIAADQLIFSTLYTLVFFVGVGMLSGTVDRLELLYNLSMDKPLGKTGLNELGYSNSIKDETDETKASRRAKYEDLVLQLKQHLLEEERLAKLILSDNNALIADATSQETLDEGVARELDYYRQHDDIEHSEHNSGKFSRAKSDLQVEEENLRLIHQVVQRMKLQQELNNRSLSWSAIWQRTWQHTREVFFETYIADCAIWPPLQLINFTFVPLRFQFLFVNIANLGWNTFLSLMANKKHG